MRPRARRSTGREAHLVEALRGVPRAEIVAGPSRGGGLALGLARDEALAEEVELAVILVHPPGPVHVLRLVRVDELRRRGGPVGGVVVEGHVVALELFVVVGAVVVAVEAEARGDDAHRGGHGHDAGDAERADADDAEGADGDATGRVAGLGRLHGGEERGVLGGNSHRECHGRRDPGGARTRRRREATPRLARVRRAERARDVERTRAQLRSPGRAKESAPSAAAGAPASVRGTSKPTTPTRAYYRLRRVEAKNENAPRGPKNAEPSRAPVGLPCRTMARSVGPALKGTRPIVRFVDRRPDRTRAKNVASNAGSDDFADLRVRRNPRASRGKSGTRDSRTTVYSRSNASDSRRPRPVG